MAFTELDQKLIDECTKDVLDLEKIKMLIADGADINAFDEEYEQELYDSILDYYIDEEQPNLSNLREITKLFLENDLILNHKPEDNDYFLPRGFIFLPPEEICVDIFKLLLEKGHFSFEDLDGIIVRVTENCGKDGKIVMSVPDWVKKVYITDMPERKREEVSFSDTLRLDIRGFEIATLRFCK